MRIAIVGAGYVGLVSGACFSEFGVDVACIDHDGEKIAALGDGRIPIYEPGLDDLVARNVAAGRLAFATELAPAVAGTDAVFIAVGTPSRRGDGHADLSYVFAAAEQIAAAITARTVVVTKSTVPVGTGAEVERVIAKRRPELVAGQDFDVAANPEFLREGSAIEDFLHPDRVVVGAETEHARAVLGALYRPLFLRETPILNTTRETAELIKYAANAFLATKITFINEIADLCEAVGADVQLVAKGIGLDGRIGAKFLHPGPGYGGSCFPKDALALIRTARERGAPARIVETVVEVNEARKRRMAEKVIAACGGSVAATAPPSLRSPAWLFSYATRPPCRITTGSASASMISGVWLVRTMERPEPANCRSKSRAHMAAAISRPAKGSSIKRTHGSWRRAAHRESFWRIPRE